MNNDMTLKEIKDKVAIEYGYESFNDFLKKQDFRLKIKVARSVEDLMDEVAERYAQQKLQQAGIVRPGLDSSDGGELLGTEEKAQSVSAVKVKTGTVIFCEGENFVFGINRRTGKPECFNLYRMSGISDEAALPLGGG